MTNREPGSKNLELLHSSPSSLSNHTLWVCFLSPKGYETFTSARYANKQIDVVEQPMLSKKSEVSTIQFWDSDEKQVTAIVTGRTDDGELLYQTVEMIVASQTIPEFAIKSLERRAKMQPYNIIEPTAPIYPLLQLPPFKEIE